MLKLQKRIEILKKQNHILSLHKFREEAPYFMKFERVTQNQHREIRPPLSQQPRTIFLVHIENSFF